MTLPWKILILSIALMLGVVVMELEYLIGWVFSLNAGPVSWEETGGRQAFIGNLEKWLVFLMLGNGAAWAWHFASGALNRADRALAPPTDKPTE